MPIVTKKINQELICWVDKRDYVPKADIRKVVDEFDARCDYAAEQGDPKTAGAYNYCAKKIFQLIKRGSGAD